MTISADIEAAAKTY